MRRLAAVAALLLLTACGGGDGDDDRTNDAGATWKGPRALATAEADGEVVTWTPVTVADPDAVTARLLDRKVTAKVVPGPPAQVSAERPAARGEAPGERDAVVAAEKVLTAFGMEPGEWRARVTVLGGVRVVAFTAGSDLPLLPRRGFVVPHATVRVDAGGVRAFEVTPVRLAKRAVRLRGEAAAFADLAEPGTYVGAFLVLVADGTPEVKPFYDFVKEGGERELVSAVLTP